MTSPVPGASVGTPYGRRGSYWSCDQDANGNGIHTGVDYPAPTGAKVVAARPGKVVYASHGDAFGYHQLEVLPGDGTRDFYAHMRERTPADGSWVEAGQKVGEVGSEGNSTGPHLHFERHAAATGGWSCSIIRDPQPSVDYEEEEDVDYDKIRQIVAEEVQENNKALVDKVWDELQEVTTPDGKKDKRAMRQLARETWQRVAKSGP